MTIISNHFERNGLRFTSLGIIHFVTLVFMVATKARLAERFVPPPASFIQGRWLVPRFTRWDAEALVRMGIVPEDASTELLNGLIVLKDRAAVGQDATMIGNDHVKSVEKLSDLRSRLNSPGRHIRSQQPLVCSDTHQPEPDFMIVRGTLDDYVDIPTAADAFCVVEVADASYERDTGEKLEAYAQAGVKQYIVINLRNRTAEVYAHADSVSGTYPPPQILKENETLTLQTGDVEGYSFLLARILP